MHDDLRTLSEHLSTLRVGRAHEHHAQLSSTNDRAFAWLGEGAPDGALVTADAQTAGRGRLGRSWQSPPGRDIYATVLLRPGAPPAEIGALALAVGLGLHRGLTQLFGPALAQLGLKWPNDLLLGRRKLAGILCESRWRGSEVELVVGFGLNVHRLAEEFAPELRARATSLAIALPEAQRRGRVQVLAAMLQGLESTLERYWQGGFAAIRQDYEARCVVLGQAIEVETPDGQRTAAIAAGLAPDGALLAQPREGGPSYRVQSADVHWLASY